MKLSVVMAVRNGARTLPVTLDSIQAQSERDFELIVVDDGSTDDTAAIVDERKRSDARIRLIRQDPMGLTAALVRGCAEARASVIARHDCGDRSMPERFAHQLELLEGHALVSCATSFIEPDGHLLYVSRASGEEVRRSLLEDDSRSIRSIPHHGSAMFRRDVYRASGGYRPEFRLAQDLDLWIRIARQGSIAITDEVLYEAVVDERSISGTSRREQVELTRIAVALRDNGDERSLLEKASRIRASGVTRGREAAAFYFIGRCLLSRGDPKGREYLRRAVNANPFHLRARVALLLGR